MKFCWTYSTENLYFGIRKAASLNILKKSLLAKRDFLEVIFASDGIHDLDFQLFFMTYFAGRLNKEGLKKDLVKPLP